MDLYPFAPADVNHAVAPALDPDPHGRLWIAQHTVVHAERLLAECRERLKEEQGFGNYRLDGVDSMLVGAATILRELYAQMSDARREFRATTP